MNSKIPFLISFFISFLFYTSAFPQNKTPNNIYSNVKLHSIENKCEREGSETVIERSSKNTITPVLLNHGDILEFTLRNGKKRTMKLLETNASIIKTNVKNFSEIQRDGGTICRFSAKVLIDGHIFNMKRYLPTQESFYEPYVINGMRIWFDAVKDYFDFFTEKHGWCEPRADARFAVSDAKDPVAPEIAKWYPSDSNYINVKDCYLGDDTWMGAYLGIEPHGGLDVNTPKGTPLFSPFDFTASDDQLLEVGFEPKPYYWAATWKGIKKWNNGSIWTLKSLHLDKYLVENYSSINKGTQYAEAAGTGVGAEEHSHFEFMIRGDSTNSVDNSVMVKGHIVGENKNTYNIFVNGVTGEVPKNTALYIKREDRPQNYSIFMVPKNIAIENDFKYEIPQIPMDPWYLFWQMFENDKARKGLINAHITPMEPVKTGKTVSFSSEGSHSGPGSEDLSYYWTFGDGGWSNKKNPNHIYSTPGIYPVSLVVDDGKDRDRFTQHITVNGKKVNKPVLSLNSPKEPSFDRRKPFVMDTYGSKIKKIPNTLYFLARHTNPQPEAKMINLLNKGQGELEKPTINVSYQKGGNWVEIIEKNNGNQNNLTVKVDSKGLSPGTYIAKVRVATSNALNSPQKFRVCFKIPSNMPQKEVIIDDSDPGFYATPYYWVGGRFHRWTEGYKDFYLTNGGLAKDGEYFRFTPDLQEGKYRVSFLQETPFKDCELKVWIHHAKGDSLIMVKPNKSRTIGDFYFSEGKDGFVQVYASGSKGEVIADAVEFKMIEENIGTSMIKD